MPADRLFMLALGIQGDHPVDAEQPPLVDANHLRWVTDPDAGFPWGGFYLFRRESQPSRRVCLMTQLDRFHAGATQTTQIDTRVGQLSSPKPLLFTDDFAPAGVVEAGLGAGLRFDLPPGVTMQFADIFIGFRAGEVTRTCVDFRQVPLGSGPNPRTENGAVFTIEPLLTPPTAESSIDEVGGSPHGLQGLSRFESSVRIGVDLPCAATTADLTLTNPTGMTVEGFDAAGASLGAQTFAANALSAGAVRVSGKAIKRVVIQSSGTESALLHQVCWECPAEAQSSGQKIDIDFSQRAIGDREDPFVEQGVQFDVDRTTFPLAMFAKNANGATGLQGRIDIKLPCTTTSVSMSLTTTRTVHIDAFNADGTPAQSVDLAPGTGLSTVLTGTAIKSISIYGYPETLLHHLSLQCNGVTTAAPISIIAMAHGAQVFGAQAAGAPGEIVHVVLNPPTPTGFDGISFSAGNAALVDLCYLPARQTDTFGWEEIPEFQYPLSLPVADAAYPCPSKPATPADAATLAHSRVTYQAPTGWDQQFPQLHDELVALVHGGPQAGPMATREHPTLTGQPLSPATQESPSMPNLHPLELVLLASLHPAMAQMLGLYFADQSVRPNVAYDYLLLADHDSVLDGTANAALDWIAFSTDHDPVDMARADNVTSAPRPTIAAPGAPRAYALPAMAVRNIDGTMQNGVGAAGLSWDLPADSTQPEPDRIIFYYPHRASLGTATPTAQPAPGDYNVPLQPILVSEPDPVNPPVTPQRSSDWPPVSVPLYLVDGSLPEGWYSYELSGQDLFGRRSALGPPSEWYQWDPLQSVHPYAVALLDKIPPPAPLGVEAWALDPDDRWVLQDQPYKDWRALPTVPARLVGLRVRWRWTFMQQLQAPDTAEFRIYYQPGRWNALVGDVDSVTAATTTQSDVDLDFADSRAADTFAGTRLRVGNDDFAVIGSQPGAQLRLRVQNIGANDEITPAAGKPCTIAIPEGHALFVDTGVPGSWARQLAHVPYDPPARTVFDVAVEDAAGTAFVNGATIQLPASVDLSVIQPWIDHIRLGGVFYPIVQFDDSTHTVTLASVPAVSSQQAWAIGRPAREYDVFLDCPDTAVGQPFDPTLAEPTVFAQVAVSATDDDGNESRLSPSATIYRVRQKPPDAPQLPPLPDRLYATPADYHHRSYSTFRFIPVPNLRIHILRALDDSLFQRDWLVRQTRIALDPTAHADYFPDGMSAGDRATVAALLNAITPLTDYTTLSTNALAVLALLPGNEHASNLAARDASIRASLATVPVAALPDYANLLDPALHALAGFPGNEAAFTQVTLNPFEMSDPTIADSRRSDDADGYAPQANIRAYTDTLPGRATNRYFYRALFVDGAQNQSALSIPGPVVYLRKVDPPRTPVITGVISGERAITIQWAPNSDPTLAFYRLYRIDDQAKADDVRRMVIVAEGAVSDFDPAKEPEYTDRIGLVSGQSVFYRLSVIDSGGSESRPSSIVRAVVVDSTPPPAPAWVNEQWLLKSESDGALLPWPEDGLVPSGYQPALQLQWRSDTANPRFEITRRRSGERLWATVAGTVESMADSRSFALIDESADATVENAYRLRVRSSSGVWCADYATAAIAVPDPPPVVATEGTP